jgi:hypothetical protein
MERGSRSRVRNGRHGISAAQRALIPQARTWADKMNTLGAQLEAATALSNGSNSANGRRRKKGWCQRLLAGVSIGSFDERYRPRIDQNNREADRADNGYTPPNKASRHGSACRTTAGENPNNQPATRCGASACNSTTVESSNEISADESGAMPSLDQSIQW